MILSGLFWIPSEPQMSVSHQVEQGGSSRQRHPLAGNRNEEGGNDVIVFTLFEEAANVKLGTRNRPVSLQIRGLCRRRFSWALTGFWATNPNRSTTRCTRPGTRPPTSTCWSSWSASACWCTPESKPAHGLSPGPVLDRCSFTTTVWQTSGSTDKTCIFMFMLKWKPSVQISGKTLLINHCGLCGIMRRSYDCKLCYIGGHVARHHGGGRGSFSLHLWSHMTQKQEEDYAHLHAASHRRHQSGAQLLRQSPEGPPETAAGDVLSGWDEEETSSTIRVKLHPLLLHALCSYINITVSLIAL